MTRTIQAEIPDSIIEEIKAEGVREFLAAINGLPAVTPPMTRTLSPDEAHAKAQIDNLVKAKHITGTRGTDHEVILLTHRGRTQTVKDWSAEVGLTTHCIYSRLKRGLSAYEALTTPLLQFKKGKVARYGG